MSRIFFLMVSMILVTHLFSQTNTTYFSLWVDGMLVKDTENLELAIIYENGVVKPFIIEGESILTSDLHDEEDIDLLVKYKRFNCVYHEFNKNYLSRRIDFHIDTKPFNNSRKFKRKWWKRIRHLYYFELTENISREKLNELAKDGVMYSVMESEIFVWYR